MTGVIVQCRLSSTRLPAKALLPLNGIPLAAHTLRAMKKVPSDVYILATDEASYPELLPLARSEGWECFAGPRDDVLERFCRAIETYAVDTVVRATGDNPFLFYEAALESLAMFAGETPDYLTFTSLPHGSGVEIISARALLKARNNELSAVEREHVGPALYNHPDIFDCRFVPAPACYSHPQWRTTVDTPADYRRAVRVTRVLSRLYPQKKAPYSTGELSAALTDEVCAAPVLIVPSVKKGRGTGHLRRMGDLALHLDADLYIPGEADLQETPAILDTLYSRGFPRTSVIDALPEKNEYALIVSDLFSMTHGQAEILSSCAPLAAVDEGSLYTHYCDYLLNIIPPACDDHRVNMVQPGFIPLPEHRKQTAPDFMHRDFSGYDSEGVSLPPAPHDVAGTPPSESAVNKTESRKPLNVLVTFGGEDPARLTPQAVIAAYEAGAQVTAIVADVLHTRSLLPEQTAQAVAVIPAVPNLRETLYEYDAVITHYGLTAFEAVYAGCSVILAGTTPLHTELAKKYGFAVFTPGMSTDALKKMLAHPQMPVLPGREHAAGDASVPPAADLPQFVRRLSHGTRFACPVCGSSDGPVAARTQSATYRQCPVCGMTYMAFRTGGTTVEYTEEYFFENYKKQYGKTYLEDFDTIKQRGLERMVHLNGVYSFTRTVKPARLGGKKSPHNRPARNLLDAGCAYGPFLRAASEKGWQVYGLDVAQSAVDYVCGELNLPACRAPLETFDPMQEFGIDGFDAVTLWFVIEHFDNAGAVLKKLNTLLKKGGILAFSTPSAAGISAQSDPQRFFETSPHDHHTLWSPKTAAAVLSRFGFRVVKIVSTGHHPERFPEVKKHPHNFLTVKTAAVASRLLKLGDTFEVYCIKESGEVHLN